MLFRQLLLSRKSVPATGIVSSNPKPNSLLPNVHNICAEGFNRVLRRPGESVLPAPVLPPLPWSASQRQLRTLEGESEDINKPLLWQLSHQKALEAWPLIVRENAPWLLTIILVCFRQSQTAAASFNVSQFSNTSKSFRWGLKRTSCISFRCKLVNLSLGTELMKQCTVDLWHNGTCPFPLRLHLLWFLLFGCSKFNLILL